MRASPAVAAAAAVNVGVNAPSPTRSRRAPLDDSAEEVVARAPSWLTPGKARLLEGGQAALPPSAEAGEETRGQAGQEEVRRAAPVWPRPGASCAARHRPGAV